MILLEIGKYLNNLFKRAFLSLIILLLISFALKNNYFYDEIYNMIYSSNIDFSYVKSKTKLLMGNILRRQEKFVSSNKLIYKNIEKINNSYKLYTDANYVINNINPGVVIFIGNKETLGYTVIVEGDNGIDYWYSNIENISVNLYDYIDSSAIIGSTISDYLILTLTKDSEYLSYEEYI